ALPVQREVADTHIAEVFQARADFPVQELERLDLSRRGGIFSIKMACNAHRKSVTSYFFRSIQHVRIRGHTLEELAQAVDGQQHQVVQAQAWQGFELRACPL